MQVKNNLLINVLKCKALFLSIGAIFLATVTYASVPYRAIVVVPVADLVGAPIQAFFPNKMVTAAYREIAICGGRPAAHSYCPRIHQLLFNEVGTVVKEQGQEVLIQISNCFYVPKDSIVPQYSYWMLKENIISLQELELQGVDVSCFPPPISFNDPRSINNQKVATLAMPWCDPITQQIFSAGTRFLKVVDQQTQHEQVLVFIFNPTKGCFNQISIQSHFLVEDSPSSVLKKIELFIRILKKWTHLTNEFIPYVLGGCSFTYTTNNPFAEKADSFQALPCTYYEISDFDYAPKPGFDCSNLILRAAQLAGIPFFLKNSQTIATFLQPLNATQKLENGDIIWKKGHVIVVADIMRGTVIEARGYNRGCGRVQEIELNKVFKGITTFDELTHAWRTGQSIERLGDDGSIIDIITEFKLLSLRSIMD